MLIVTEEILKRILHNNTNVAEKTTNAGMMRKRNWYVNNSSVKIDKLFCYQERRR